MISEPRLFDINLYYHIYNCGVGKRDIFSHKKDYARFMDLIDFYRYEQNIPYTQFKALSQEAKDLYIKIHPRLPQRNPLKITSYCLMPNHFHFLIKVAKKKGIPIFMSKLANSYTKYFNIKYERLGSLFQGRYKSKEIPSDQAVLQVTRYIHINSVESEKTNPHGNLKPENYPYSSYPLWISSNILNLEGSIIDNKDVNRWVELAGGQSKYKEFVESKIGKQPRLGIASLVLE